MKEAVRSDFESLSSGPDPNLGKTADTVTKKETINTNIPKTSSTESTLERK
jgi:hypothetical protein